MIKKLMLIILLVLNVSILKADDVLQREKKIDAIFDTSGIQKQTLQLKESIESSLKDGIRSNKKLTPEQVEKLFQISMEEFRPEVILVELKKRLIKEWSEKDVDILYEFYNRDEVKKFSRLEEEGTSISARPAFVEYAKSLANNPPEKERISIINNFILNAKIVEIAINVVTDVYIGMGIAFNSEISENDLAKLRMKLTPAMAQSFPVFYLFLYRDVPTSELRDYLSQYSSNKNLRRLSEDFVLEQNKNFKLWGLNLGIRIKKEFKTTIKHQLKCE